MSAHASSRYRILGGALTVVLASSMIGMLTACSEADSAASPRADAPVEERLGEIAQQAADEGSLGVIVRVDRGTGEPVEIARQSDWAKADHRLAVDDQFRVASNTKTVTATLLLQQVAQHKVGLDDPVEKWLPRLLPNGPNVTVKMLLNHTSGLGDYLLTPEFLPSLTGQDERTWTPEELLAITPILDADPGENYSYSNANYAALGLILEKSTGQSLAGLIEQKIIEPLGMADSFLATDASWSPGKSHASGYEPNAERLRSILAPTVELPEGVGFAGPERAGGNVDTTAIDPSWAGAAGGMVSTAKDWQRFQTALLSGELLPAAQLEQMRTTVPAPEEGGGYGLGLMEVNTPCGTVWGHTGGQPGYSSEIYTDESGQRSVAVLTTTNFNIKEPEAATANSALVDAAVCTMLDKPLPDTNIEPSR